ncbi:MAG: phage tail sheath family protein, partial [Cloacibacillus sp.]
MAFYHGVKTTETPTSLIAPAPCEAAMPVYFGVAPIHRTASLANKVNYPILCNSYDDAVLALGYSKDWETWGLCENIYAQFALFAMSPCVFVNVFDPATHKAAVSAEAATLAAGTVKLAHAEAILSTVVVKDSSAATTYVKDTDYTIAYDADYKCVVTKKTGGAIASETAELKVTYDYADPSLVDADDIIGGINAISGAEEGLEVIERVFPITRKVPGLIVATGWSENTEVLAVMTAKAWNINGLFKAVALVDIPVTGTGAPTLYTD